jgi:hypothetical protein
MTDFNELAVCRICGLIQPDAPWGETGKDPSHDICPCCGVEFGYEDCLLSAIRKYRDAWIDKGSKWWNPKLQPTVWDIEEQLKNIPARFR